MEEIKQPVLGNELIQTYPYKINLKESPLSVSEVINQFDLKLNKELSKSKMVTHGYSSKFFVSKDNEVAFFSFTQEGTDYYNQEILGFKNEQEFLKFNN